MRAQKLTIAKLQSSGACQCVYVCMFVCVFQQLQHRRTWSGGCERQSLLAGALLAHTDKQRKKLKHVTLYLLALSRFDDDGCRQQQPPPAQHSIENYARVSLPIYLHKTIGLTRRIVKPNKIVQGQLNRQRQPMSGRFNILIPQRLDTVCVFAVKHSVQRWPKCASSAICNFAWPAD